MPRPSKYSEDFRRDAVDLVRSSGRTIRDVGREPGVNHETLRGWVSAAKRADEQRAGGGSADGGELSGTERDELRRLRRKVAELELEKEILRKAVIQAAWPGLPAGSITNRLYTTLHDLRAQLTDLLDQPLIVRRGDHYALNAALVDVDLWRLQAAAGTAAAAITTADQRDAYRTLLQQYGGELVAEYSWAWLAGPREAVRNLVVDAYMSLTDDLGAADALPLLREAITVDPYNEQLHHRTIGALVEVNDHQAAIRLYETYSERLIKAGLQPADAMTQLRRRISRR